MSSQQLFACTVLSLVVSCSLPTMDVVRDFSAIHNPSSWQPQSPAQMSVSPDFYLGNATARASGAGLYAVDDHRALELAMIEQINGVDANDPAMAIEVCSWMLIELSQDDHTEARVNATYVLLRLAGTWAERSDVRWQTTEEGADLVAAVRALDAATDHMSFIAAVEQLRRTQIPDVLSGVRILSALGRLAHQHGLSSGQHDEIVFSAALGIVIQSFEMMQQESDLKVADANKVCLDFIHLKSRRS